MSPSGELQPKIARFPVGLCVFDNQASNPQIYSNRPNRTAVNPGFTWISVGIMSTQLS